jgi:hypothetical protein
MRRDLETASAERREQINDIKARFVWLLAALSVVAALLVIHALMGILTGA